MIAENALSLYWRVTRRPLEMRNKDSVGKRPVWTNHHVPTVFMTNVVNVSAVRPVPTGVAPFDGGVQPELQTKRH
ncbi:hypothetical protein KDW_23330 [Dictyobacter vulcani]|uniref:Uncharacterized protein n=1 Tax=Dictyobacter vulcani TaxID=2607529 RepID=A0A5J4KP96_9CHLR|nr:hypothetical protein [Dictyobacter vulcani]GER88171.1 hypothetical protein KDW_23330 [Dictyobacter vulcani]